MISTLLLLCSLGDDRLHDTVDIWERNRLVCPQTGNEVMVQHIWWDMTKTEEFTDYVVRGWRLDKDVPCVPHKTADGWVGVFRDGRDRVQRVVRARLYVETETTVDYERLDATRVPSHLRGDLRRKEAGQ